MCPLIFLIFSLIFKLFKGISSSKSLSPCLRSLLLHLLLQLELTSPLLPHLHVLKSKLLTKHIVRSIDLTFLVLILELFNEAF